MKTLNAIIVDDEPASVIALSNLLNRFCPEVNIVETANEVEDAYAKINQCQPQIVFLDVDLAPYSGFDLLRKFSLVDFKVIFVTAYDYYAIEAIKFSALYYLLKPVKIEELKLAVERAKVELQNTKISYDFSKVLQEDFRKIKNLTINTHQGVFIVELDDIIHLKSDNSYTYFILQNGEPIISSKPIKEYEEMLCDKGFFRTHKSHIVNLDYVVAIHKTEGDQVVMKNKEKIPLSIRRREEFNKALATLSL
jgi:two-component system LytT family response regulator